MQYINYIHIYVYIHQYICISAGKRLQGLRHMPCIQPTSFNLFPGTAWEPKHRSPEGA